MLRLQVTVAFLAGTQQLYIFFVDDLETSIDIVVQIEGKSSKEQGELSIL